MFEISVDAARLKIYSMEAVFQATELNNQMELQAAI